MTQINTLYGPQPKTIMDRFTRLKLLVCDVDGVFSDGRIYLGNQGEELKAFHTRDGYGVKALVNIGLQVAVITGRRSDIVEQRMTALGVQHIIQGCEEKQRALEILQAKLGISKDAMAAIGDDMPDIGMFNRVGVAIAVADAHPFVKKSALFITQLGGGRGAVREVCDLILQAKGQINKTHGTSS